MPTVHIFTDGSAFTNPPGSGGGLAIFHNSQWTFTAHSFNDDTDSNLAESKAILKALETAVRMIDTHDYFPKVVIYSDSRNALELLAQRGETARGRDAEQLREIAERSVEARSTLIMEEVEVKTEWVRAHARMTGNVYADLLARFVFAQG